MKIKEKVPARLFDAAGDLALAIVPHQLDKEQRRKVRDAIIVLVDYIIEIGEKKND